MNSRDPSFSDQVLEVTLGAVRARRRRRHLARAACASLAIAALAASIWPRPVPDPEPVAEGRGSGVGGKPASSGIRVVTTAEIDPRVEIFSNRDTSLEVRTIGDEELIASLRGQPHAFVTAADGTRRLWLPGL